MQRRSFINQSLAAVSTLAMSTVIPANASAARVAAGPFKLNYAPHDGMFKNHAGADFVEQINFMHDQGFRAVEDNGMLGRSVTDQEKIGKTLADLGMTMGVFVVDSGDNWKTSLTTGKQEFKDNFIKTCRQSVEVARRVNTKWSNGDPGFYGR